MMRSVLSFFSILAFGAMTAAVLVALLPWLSGHVPAGLQPMANGLQFESLVLGMVLGTTLGSLGRYNWADIPRRIITWFLVREQYLFHFAVIVACGAVLFFY